MFLTSVQKEYQYLANEIQMYYYVDVKSHTGSNKGERACLM